MMKGKRRGFTVVELVIVIAVVAILAAVLIPTYVNLVKKSNEANALAEAKNLISEMLTDIILGDKDSADLLIFSKKGDDVYLHGYSAEQQKFLTYRNNPIALTTDMETTVQATVGKLLAEEVIKQNPDVDIEKNPNDWRLENNVRTIIETLSTKYDVVVYANYIIDANLFAPHVHTWETAWAFDGTHHWHKCVGCDEITGKAEHVFGADGKCVCGAIKPTEEHTHEFNMKNVADKYRKSVADCKNPAVYYFSCACGAIESKTFDYGTKLGHSFGNGNVTTQPTCTSQGKMTYTCTRCGETKEVAIPARGHAWDAGKVTTPATCKVTGVKTFKCTICKTTKTEAIPALGHTWDAGKITKEPTYVSEGAKEYTCTVCRETKVEVLDKKQAIIANEGEFKKAFEEAMSEEAKTLRVKLTSDLNLAKTDCFPPVDEELFQRHLPFGSATLEIDLNGHTLYCKDNSSYFFLYLVKGSKLVLKNGIVDGFPFEIEANAEVHFENITLKNAGFVLDLAGYEAGENGGIPESNPPAILELNNCKAIYGENEFDITKDNFGRECCDIDHEFRARIFVNGEKATVEGNTFEY